MDAQDEFRELFLRHGPGPVVASFIKQKFHQLELNSILEETFRRIDLGPRDPVCNQGAYVSLEVEFLIRHGAFFEKINKLLKDTYQYIELGPKRRERACLGPEVQFLLIQGADFKQVPGLPQIVEDTKTYLEGSNNVPNFLLQQATRYNIHGNWSPLLENVNKSLLKVVDSETLCEIVRLISSHQKEIKVYTTPFRVDGWPIVTYSLKRNSLIDAAIAELRKRRGCWDEVLIEAQGRYITTLKPLLSARSPFFKELFEDNPKQKSFELSGLYKTTKFAVLYERSEIKLLSKEYRPCDSRVLTEDNLEELLNILSAAKRFRMVDVFGEVQRHITHHGGGFIYSRNAQEIKDIATEMNAALLERYCDAFIATNLRKFTLFLSLPTELRISIWSQVASRPRVVFAHKLHESLQTPRHIAIILRVCRDSKAEVEQFWGRSRMGGVKFEVDILWLEARYLPPPISLEEARYCATPAPDADLQFDWGINVLRIIKCCPRLEALYLAIADDNDEFEYCRRFTNREPTTRAEARNLIEEGAHQRLQHEWLYQGDSPSDYILPKIILICEDDITRLADQHF